MNTKLCAYESSFVHRNVNAAQLILNAGLDVHNLSVVQANRSKLLAFGPILADLHQVSVVRNGDRGFGLAQGGDDLLFCGCAHPDSGKVFSGGFLSYRFLIGNYRLWRIDGSVFSARAARRETSVSADGADPPEAPRPGMAAIRHQPRDGLDRRLGLRLRLGRRLGMEALAAFLVAVSVCPKILVMALLRGFPAAVRMVAPEAAAACSARLCAWAAVTNKKLPSKATGVSKRMDFSL